MDNMPDSAPKNSKANGLFRPQVNFMESCPNQQNITGHVHHLSADEAQKNPEVVGGMFSVNNILAIIIFDSGLPTLLFLVVSMPKTNFLALFCE